MAHQPENTIYLIWGGSNPVMQIWGWATSEAEAERKVEKLVLRHWTEHNLDVVFQSLISTKAFYQEQKFPEPRPVYPGDGVNQKQYLKDLNAWKNNALLWDREETRKRLASYNAEADGVLVLMGLQTVPVVVTPSKYKIQPVPADPARGLEPMIDTCCGRPVSEYVAGRGYCADCI